MLFDADSVCVGGGGHYLVKGVKKVTNGFH